MQLHRLFLTKNMRSINYTTTQIRVQKRTTRFIPQKKNRYIKLHLSAEE